MKDILSKGFDEFKIHCDSDMLSRFELYYELLTETNKKFNLTAITEKTEVAVKHFLDCASLLSVLDISEGQSVIDVGCGAGFPGLVLKICRPDIELTLLDALRKRVDFLSECAEKLGLDAVNCIHGRAEDMARRDEYRESFDVCTSRAVAAMPTLSELCLPFVKVGGVFAPLKGPMADDELEKSKNALDILGGGNARVKRVSIYSSELSHAIVLVDKISETPSKYPRSGNKASAKPL